MVKVNATINKLHYKTEITSESNIIISDAPVANGGKAEGFTPEELLCASLASCTTITLRMYADRKEWPLEKMDVEVTLERDEEKNISYINRKIHFSGDLSEEQKQRLLVIADKCPIHKVLSNQITITTSEQ
jgi:putative redox protein